MNKSLKRGAIIPVTLICGGLVFLISEMTDEKSTLITSNYKVNNNTFLLSLSEAEITSSQFRKVDFQLRTSQSLSETVKVTVTYFSNGRGESTLDNNIQAIDYQYSINNDTLVMNRYFELQPDAYYRGQQVSVLIELPQNITLVSSHNLGVKLQGDQIGYELLKRSNTKAIYATAAQYIHENNEINQQRITANERSVLTAKFCQLFFERGRPRCLANIRKSAVESSKLKQEYINETIEVDEIRSYLMKNKVIGLEELTQLNSFISFLIKKYPELEELQIYIQHLLAVKNSLAVKQLAPS